MTENKWIAVDKFTRKISTTLAKSGVTSHHLNVPEKIFNKICDNDNCGTSKEIQLAILRNQDTGAHIICIIGIDDFEKLLRDVNKEGV